MTNPADTAPDDEGARPRSGLRRAFDAATNLLNIGRGIAIVGIVAVGETIVIIAGGFDLSVGSTMAASGMAAAWLINLGIPLPLAFAALAEGQPSAFRNFLLKAPSLFIPIGEAVGVIRHIDSFWRFRFPEASTPMMEADEAIEVLHDFETTVEGVEFVKGKNEHKLAS